MFVDNSSIRPYFTQACDDCDEFVDALERPSSSLLVSTASQSELLCQEDWLLQGPEPEQVTITFPF